MISTWILVLLYFSASSSLAARLLGRAGRFFVVGCVLGSLLQSLAAVRRAAEVHVASASSSLSRFASAGLAMRRGARLRTQFAACRRQPGWRTTPDRTARIVPDPTAVVGRQVARAQNDDRPRLLPEKERDLHHADGQTGIQQQRQDDDHEQRPPVANLVADLAMKDEADFCQFILPPAILVRPRRSARRILPRSPPAP